MKLRGFIVVLAILLTFCSCKKQPNGGPPTPTPAVTANVYAIGLNYKTGSLPLATYWKNGVAMHFADSTTSLFRGIAVKDSDVYIVGYKTTSNQEFAICWKNGVPTTIATGAIATGIAINGNDIYISGEAATGNKTPISGPETMPLYWKNGIAVNLPGGVYGGSTRGIAVQGNDVYVAGYQCDNRGFAVATYWKNTTATNLLTADSPTQPYANNVVVQGSDVYVCANYSAGSNSTALAMYWKNGTVVPMGGVEPYFSPYNIAVQNSDIYVVGVNSSSQTGVEYVKNGITYHLTDASNPGRIYAIALFNNDVYMGGYSTNTLGVGGATIWKNGFPIMATGQDMVVTGLAVAAQ